MNKDQYLTKRNQFDAKSAKVDGINGSLSVQPYVAEWGSCENQAPADSLESLYPTQLHTQAIVLPTSGMGDMMLTGIVIGLAIMLAIALIGAYSMI